MRTPTVPVAVGLFILVGQAAAGGAPPLPDLVAFIDDRFTPQIERNATVDAQDVAEGCAGSTTGRTVVHFALSTVNEGTADLVLGDPGCPDCEEFAGPVCANELFECSPLMGHGHPHFTKYALYEILAAPDDAAAATGHKQSFCLEDTICGNKVYDCFNQGLSVGCTDLYPPYALGCQYVDVTDLPGGRYVLRATINHEHLLTESRYDNNTDAKVVEVCEPIVGPSVRMKVRKTEPGVVYWKVRGRAYAKAPLVTPDPFKDGATLRLEADGTTIADVVLPGRPGSGHCGPKDGWKHDPETGTTYRNESGFLDRDCAISADGLYRFRAVVQTGTKKGVSVGRVKYAVSGKSSIADAVTRVRATVGLGTETGPCWIGAATCDPVRRRCTADSAAGAFVD